LTETVKKAFITQEARWRFSDQNRKTHFEFLTPDHKLKLQQFELRSGRSTFEYIREGKCSEPHKWLVWAYIGVMWPVCVFIRFCFLDVFRMQFVKKGEERAGVTTYTRLALHFSRLGDVECVMLCFVRVCICCQHVCPTFVLGNVRSSCNESRMIVFEWRISYSSPGVINTPWCQLQLMSLDFRNQFHLRFLYCRFLTILPLWLQSTKFVIWSLGVINASLFADSTLYLDIHPVTNLALSEVMHLAWLSFCICSVPVEEYCMHVFGRNYRSLDQSKDDDTTFQRRNHGKSQERHYEVH